ncbi:hypothetical protein [Stappia indica]|uniref:hypothetical protein n=1 Tax=Stappia indica TaxID=538381 RepID=UPI001CD5C23B|nr:hypothetical protein [Stappia indica]MCA1299078.1 hypothetical protein [Stappia indica]
MTVDTTGRAPHRGVTFQDREVLLDGGAFHGCVFIRCHMVYEGGVPPVLSGCHFEGCRWGFAGAAANTLLMLGALRQGGFEAVVDRTLAAIHDGSVLNSPAAEAVASTMNVSSSATGRGAIDLGFGTFPIPRILRRRQAANDPTATE